MGRSGHLLSPTAEQDAYPLNWPPVTIQTSKHRNRVLHRGAIDAAVIAGDNNGTAQKSTSQWHAAERERGGNVILLLSTNTNSLPGRLLLNLVACG